MRYSDYVGLVAQAVSGAYGPSAGYLPNIYRDLALTAAALGQDEFARSQLKELASDLRGRSDYNIRIIGSVEKWVSDVEAAFGRVGRIIEAEKDKHKLAGITDHGMAFDSAVSLSDMRWS